MGKCKKQKEKKRETREGGGTEIAEDFEPECDLRDGELQALLAYEEGELIYGEDNESCAMKVTGDRVISIHGLRSN